MKIIKTVLGTKRIDAKDKHLALVQLRDLLDAHRDTLINRLIADLPSYLDYKFKRRVNAKQLETIKERLTFLKNSSVDMDKYNFIFEDVLTHDMTYVATEPFYKDIDENISWSLNDSQLHLVK